MGQFIVQCTIILICLLLSSCGKEEHCIGYIEGDYLYIAPALTGRLETLSIKRGDWVKQDALLFQLVHQFEEDGVQVALQNLNAARATLEDLKKGKRPEEITALEASRDQAIVLLELAKIQLERNEKLIKEGAVSRDQYDQSQSNYESRKQDVISKEADLKLGHLGAREDQINNAHANVLALEGALKQAEWRLEQKKCVAPKEGYVQDTFFNPGELVRVGVPVVSLLPPDNVKARFFVPESRLRRLTLNQKITLKSKESSVKVVATINYISSQAEYTPPVIFSQTSREKLVYLIEASIPREEAIKFHPGQPIDIFFNPV